MNDSPAVHEVAKSAQRRQLTVMFCDLVDSTPLAARLDPEDTADVYRVFRDLCASTIEEAGGHVAKFMGDGVLAYFGYPAAHEDDAERAVHAALTLAEAAPRLATGDDAPLAARIGIATGLVVVGDLVGDSSAEVGDVVGETPNLAARLQGAAAPNEILVSNTTKQLASDLFAFVDAGRLPLKGLKLKEPVWRATGAQTAAERFRARQERARGPMMGREAELETLLEVWRASRADGLHIVGIVGEAGIGKSRLVDEFHRAIARRGAHIWLEGAGVQIFANTPFYALAQSIQRRLASGEALTPAKRRERLAELLRLVGAYSQHALALIGELVDAAPAAGVAPSSVSEERRRALIQALCDWLIRSAGRWPTVLVVEDLQWVDPSSLEFLEALVQRAEQAPLLVLYTARRETPAPWPEGAAHRRIALGRLDRESARNLVVAAAPHALAPNLIERLVARADGVPLFAEELARLVGDDPEGVAIPSALSDLLLARLDQLGPAKELAQIAAVLGGEFPRPLLAAVSGLDDQHLARTLDELVAAGVLVASGDGDERVLAFRHALVETAAYETLLKRLRRSLHLRAAQILLERFPETAARQPEVLALHWLRGGDHDKAIAAWQRAARLAFDRHAFREAVNACGEGIKLVRSLAPARQFDGDELSLQNMQAEAWRTIEGYSSPRARAALERAKALADRHGDLPGQLRQAFGAWAEASSQGDYPAAAEPAERYVALARLEGGASVLATAHMIQMTRYRQGDLAGAEAAYRAGEIYFTDPDYLRSAGAAGQTFGIAAAVAWLSGRHDEADRRNERCLSVADSTGNPYDLAYAFYMAAHYALLNGSPSEAERASLQAIRLSEEHGYSALADAIGAMLGRARAGLGRASDGAAMIERSVHQRRRVRRNGSDTMYLTWLAEAYAMASDTGHAEATLEEALSVNPLETFYRPETLRLRGDLRRAQHRPADAKADYEAALALARSIGAVAFARRALSSLAGLEGSRSRTASRGAD